MLGYLPAQFIPQGNPMLDRTRQVIAPGLRADRQYVIVRPVTDPAILTMFAHLMATDEHLGYVPTHLLLEV